MHGQTKALTTGTGYRADIDGLRAIAVLSVLYFHYGSSFPPAWRLTGGFTGVDIFFVISGYLITSILAKEIVDGRFSVLGFYGRRIRRILPALLVMLAASLLAGRFLLMPGDYMSLGYSAGMSAFGLSNVYFLNHTGYFDQSAELLPLLHTWSLAVEEQFYVFWPLLLVGIVAHRTRRDIGALISVLTIIGFGASLFWFDQDPKAAFYMTAPRSWELALGALLVFLPRLERGGNIATITGLVLIGTGFATIDATDFPGAVAIVPCLGAALVIWPRNTEATSARWLGFFAPIGLVSYSLYLWHWPVWVFYRIYISGAQPRIREAAGLAIVSILLAILSYRYVERPFRKPRWTASQVVRAGLAASMAVFCVGMYVDSADGLINRLSPEAMSMRSLRVMWDWDCTVSQVSSALSPVCVFGAPWTNASRKIVLWGDSNAEHFAPLIAPLAAKHNASVLLYTPCPAILGTSEAVDTFPVMPRYNAFCTEKRAALIDFLKTEHVDAVILASSWNELEPRLAGQAPLSAFEKSLSSVVHQLSAMGLQVSIIATVPHWRHDPVSCALLSVGLMRRCDQRHVTAEQYWSTNEDTIRIMTSLKERVPRLRLILPGETLCADATCLDTVNGEFIYRDTAHLRRNLSPETDRDLATILKFDELFE